MTSVSVHAMTQERTAMKVVRKESQPTDKIQNDEGEASRSTDRMMELYSTPTCFGRAKASFSCSSCCRSRSSTTTSTTRTGGQWDSSTPPHVAAGVTRFAILTCIARYGQYILVRQVIGTRTARYRAVSPKIDRRRLIEGEIDRRRSIEGEIDRRWSIEGEKGKKKKKKKKKRRKERSTSFPRIVLARAPSTLAGRLRAAAALAIERFFSRARRWNVSPRGEKDRGD
ncbi:hypothetical protein BHE74_00034896, partial [Ensete ventricosum]